MRIHGHPERRAWHAAWLGALFVVLVGLLGMHGFDSHGAASVHAIAHVMTETQVDAGSASDEAVQSVGHHGVVVLNQTGASATPISETAGHAAMDMAMSGMCMAILAVTLMALLRFRRANRFRSVLWVLSRPAGGPGFLGRDHDPPSLIRLSIQRC